MGRRSSPRGSRPGASKIEAVFVTPFLRRFFCDEKPIRCQDRLGTSLVKPLVGKTPAFVWSSRRCIPLGEDYLDDESVRPKPHTLHALSQRNQKRYAFAKTRSGQKRNGLVLGFQDNDGNGFCCRSRRLSPPSRSSQAPACSVTPVTQPPQPGCGNVFIVRFHTLNRAFAKAGSGQT